LFQQVYRDPTNDLRVRIDAASKAIGYELPRPEFSAPAGDVVPLHERLRAYARARLMAAPRAHPGVRARVGHPGQQQQGGGG
jgi:hypothetical protein